MSGFFMQIACLESEKRGAYSMLREGQDCRKAQHCQYRSGRLLLQASLLQCFAWAQEVMLHPSTSLGHRPEWLVFHELALSSKLFVKTGHLYPD